METPLATICCPVCTLFLREGISLENHLNTHPKDQVIEALVKCYSRNPNTGGVAQPNSPTSQENPCQQPNQPVFVPSAPVATTPYPAFGSSHFTAAITYQQFLSSNATAAGTVIPQYVSVPTILAAPNFIPGDPHQAVMPVLYNPYLMQQQQQQVQFYNSVRAQSPQQPLLRQILSAPVPTTSSENGSLPSNSPPTNNCSVSSTGMQLSHNQTSTSTSSSSVVHLAHNGSPVTENVQEQNSNKNVALSSPKSSESFHTDDVRQTVDVTVFCDTNKNSQNSRTENNAGKPLAESSGICENVNISSEVQTSDECYGVFCEKVEDASTETENLGFSGNVDKEEEGEEFGLDPASSPSVVETLSPGLRVRTDLNEVNPDLSPRSNSTHQPSSPENHSEPNSPGQIENIDDADGACCSEVVQNEVEAADLTDILNAGFVIPLNQETDETDEYITADAYGEFNSLSDQQAVSAIQILDSQKSDCNNSGASNETGDEVTAVESFQQVNIFEIDGMHILVPSQFLDNSSGGTDRKVTVIKTTNNVPTTSSLSNNSEKSDQVSLKSETTPTLINLDMQTDELMPPRGELSEQESVGGNDSSMWAPVLCQLETYHIIPVKRLRWPQNKLRPFKESHKVLSKNQR